MKNNVKRNRNYEKTDVAIKEAIVELANEKSSVDRVTVKELCERANISKSTFYLHYNDIENIFETVGDNFLIYFQNLIDKTIQNTSNDFSFFFEAILNFFNDSSEIIKIGLTYGKYLNYYIDQVKDILKDFVTDSAQFKNITIEKDQLLVEIKIISSGIIDFLIGLVPKKDDANLKKYAHYIDGFLERWLSLLK